MGVLFLLITLVAQAAFLVVARNAAAGAAAGATRRAGLPGADLSRERERLLRDVTETVPGARAVDTVLTIDGTEVRSSVVFSWVPPGPDLLHLRVRVEAVGALMVPP